MTTKTVVLTADPLGNLSVVIHYDTPAGNNAVGVSWATALVNSGLAKTVLPTGTGPGQISAADLAAIEAGTMVEVSGIFSIANLAGLTGLQQAAALTAVTSDVVTRSQAALAVKLNFFGFTQ